MFALLYILLIWYNSHKTCIFYSGKTYTIKELLSLGVKDVFRHAATDTSIQLSIIQVYNETVSDLLSNDSTKRLDLYDKDGSTNIRSLTMESVEDTTDMMKLINMANKKRAIGETSMNKHSSRSHLIYRFHQKGSLKGVMK